jgi:hypothetical protein
MACSIVSTRPTTIAPAAFGPATAGGTAPVDSKTTIAASTTSARRSPGPWWHLTPDQLRLVENQHSGVVEPLLERTPRSSEQQCVAHGEDCLTGQFLALALHGEHDQVAALGHHPRKHCVPDEL